MNVIPAVDVRGGRCVRLLHGDFGRETHYGDDPAGRALGFARAGAARIHLVDLDSARGRPDPLTTAAIRRTVDALVAEGIEVQLGGGIRDMSTADRWLGSGVSAVVLGSVAVREPARAEAICHAHPGRILLGLDVRDGAAQAEGWTESAGDAGDHLRRWAGWPAAGVVRTGIERDGDLSGPDLDGLQECVRTYRGPVVASGGVATVTDLQACADAGAAGAIVGRALYEGTLDLAEAYRRFPPARTPVT